MDIRYYNTLVEQHADGLYRFAHSMCRNRDDAQDVVQDAFAKMWEHKDNIDPEKAKPYLFTTAHNKVMDMFRKNKRSQEYAAQPIFHPETTSHQPAHDVQQVLHEALNTLPDVQRSVVLLRDYEGYSYDEIAAIVGLNLTQVKVYIFRARQKLKKYIGRMDLVL